ncbi:MAG: hypothetical protein PHU34_01060 [Candidatus Methanoperedens sp.]|nr:hypothetical protein [Candidatus Methanoperedens sp.]
MTDKGSVFSKGGGGTNFEQSVQTAFVTTLIIRGNVPCIPTGEITEVAFQTTKRGYQTDDLLVIAKSALGQHRLLAQIKHNIIFSSNNDTFKGVIKAFWKDFNNNSYFNNINDRLIIIKSGLTNNERNHIKTLLNWAKTHATESDFLSEVNRIKVKKEHLDIFQSALKEANDNKPLTDKELWDFLRCLDVLDYDFLNQGSVDETNFLNLIKLSKSNSTAANEKEIWNSIFSLVSKLNTDGGSVTVDSIQNDEIYRHFNIQKLNPYFKSVEKLKSDGEVILKPLKNTINGFHIERTETNQSILNSINEFPFTIVTGKPGVGKSAAVKAVLHKEFSSASVFVFRADQFNESTLANVFSKQGINETIQDLISCISLIPDKIFVIDSLEKLLEGDPENAFKQLLSLLRDEIPDIKIVCTSRKYAIDLIFQKFGIAQNNLNIVEVNPLDEQELNSVALQFPQLSQVLKNNNVKKLLQIPKYLDFAISSLNKEAEDYSNISLTEFKNKLWNNIIEDITTKKSGLSRKRSKAFSNIAIKRAKKMSLFVEPDDDIDPEAIEALEEDEVIFKDKDEYKFSPSHDILEDWALVKYVVAKYEEFSNPKELFNSLGNEPAIRRAFRLWIEDYLLDDSEKINILIKASLEDNTIERYWFDEVLVAVFKSDDCRSFFKAFEKELLNNNGEFLNRFLRLIRTSCKESSLNIPILFPIGSGWKEAIYFIREHLAELDNLRLSILNLLFDWENGLLFQTINHPDEILAVKVIALQYINQIEKGDEFWQEDIIKDKINDLISLLFILVNVAKDEIKELIARAIIAKDERSDWRIHSFYESVIKYCLSGSDLHSRNLAKESPEIITGTAWKVWKLEPKKEEEDHFSHSYSYLDKEECWGIENDDLDTFPSGIYKTPIYNLLIFHPLIGAKFIVDFVNYSVESFVNSDFEYKKDIVQLEIELNDGTVSKQWGSWELWAAYRGLSVTNYLLESLLMSLEKYLLDLANYKTETSKKNLQFLYNYFLKNSNSVAITSVLSSVAIAYPEEVGEEMLPLLSVKEFYWWDLNRSIQETGCLAPYDDEIPFAQEERWKSNQLPHRRKYRGGLRDFILYYQFNIGKLNEQIHKVFDKLQTKVGSDDIVWKKTLSEIDRRKYKAGEYDEKLGGFPIQPKYESDVSEFINSNQEEFEAQNTSLNYSGLLSKAYEKKGEISFQSWKECFKLYSKTENLNILYDRPVTLAVLGLRDFKSELSEDEIKWCIKTMAESIVTILQHTFSRNFGLIRVFNLLEKEIALNSFHLLFDNIETKEDRNELIALMIYILFAPFTEPEINKITQYVRTVFFKLHPEIGKKVWVGLIKYAKFRKVNPYFHNDHDSERLKTAKENEEKFIQSLVINDDLTLNIEEIDLENYEGYILARAFIITPYYYEIIYTNFIKKFIILLSEDLKLEEDYSYNRNRKGRQIHSETTLYTEFYLAELLLYADIKLSKSVIDLLLNIIYNSSHINSRTGRDIFEFSSKIPEYAIYKLDEIIANSNDEAQNKQLIDNFWLVWNYLYERIKTSGKPDLTSTLFLDIKWKTDLSHWKALENKKHFYHEMVTELGFSNAKSIINVLSTVGEKTLLPDGLSWLTDLLKKNQNEKKYLVTASGERLVKRLFYNHISTIKNNKQLINDFVWILDNMVDLGSSQAYMFRENVITYKKY